MLYQLWKRGDQKGQLYLAMLATIPYALPIIIARQADWWWLFAIFVPTHNGSSSDPLEGTTPSTSVSLQYTTDMIEIAEYLADKYRDKFSLCKNAGQVEKAARNGAIAAILHIEGQKLSARHWTSCIC